MTTVVFGLVGAGIWFIGDSLLGMNMFVGLVVTAIFGGVGFLFGILKIPDAPIMGKFRKAGGEYLSDIIFRFIFFKNKKKIYMYNLNRGGK